MKKLLLVMFFIGASSVFLYSSNADKAWRQEQLERSSSNSLSANARINAVIASKKVEIQQLQAEIRQLEQSKAQNYDQMTKNHESSQKLRYGPNWKE